MHSPAGGARDREREVAAESAMSLNEPSEVLAWFERRHGQSDDPRDDACDYAADRPDFARAALGPPDTRCTGAWLVRYARRNENFVLVSGEAASTADAILSRNSYLTARFLRGIKRGAG